jgi:uncharacterized protein YeaO (DUF488 family)
VTTLRTARVYDAPEPGDGTRVLVDRLWPRGVAKADAPFDTWLKEVAPSTELRHWYNHQPEHYAEFARRYRRELQQPEPQAALGELRKLVKAGPVTLLTATRELELSHLSVLAELLGGSHAGKA